MKKKQFYCNRCVYWDYREIKSGATFFPEITRSLWVPWLIQWQKTLTCCVKLKWKQVGFLPHQIPLAHKPTGCWIRNEVCAIVNPVYQSKDLCSDNHECDYPEQYHRNPSTTISLMHYKHTTKHRISITRKLLGVESYPFCITIAVNDSVYSDQVSLSSRL